MNSRMILGVVLMISCLLGPGSKKEAYADPFEMVTGQSTSQREDLREVLCPVTISKGSAYAS
ncbi:MAG: hypothetical protein J7M20_07860, partial [Deltaproteobacteria bacterium]|nr:hypothetical protein [Deltaproteobacteria bacterium]